MDANNLFDGIPAAHADELFTPLHQVGGLRIERIVSQGQASPDGFWYDQEEHEWVLVVEGSATIEFEGAASPTVLTRGSYLFIPAHVRHRVVRTDPVRQTVWLAIFYQP